MSVISVKNRLEVKPGKNGGIIQIPGCEPTSSLSALALSINMTCKNAVISAHKALSLIPGSRLVRELTPIGHLASGWFFELPSGPPPDGEVCPAACLEDWYALLRNNAEEPEEEEPECAGFDYSGCPADFDPLKITRDPNARPNSQPLSNVFDARGAF